MTTVPIKAAWEPSLGYGYTDNEGNFVYTQNGGIITIFPSGDTTGIADVANLLNAMILAMPSPTTAHGQITLRFAPGTYYGSVNIAVPNPANYGWADNTVGVDIGGPGGRTPGCTWILSNGSKGFTFPAYTFYNNTFHDFHIVNSSTSRAASGFDFSAGSGPTSTESQFILERMLFDCGSSGFSNALFYQPGTNSMNIDLHLMACVQTGNDSIQNAGGSIYCVQCQWGSSGTSAFSFTHACSELFEVQDWINSELKVSSSGGTIALHQCKLDSITAVYGLDISGSTGAPRVSLIDNEWEFQSTTGSVYLLNIGSLTPYVTTFGNRYYTAGATFYLGNGTGAFATQSSFRSDIFLGGTNGGFGVSLNGPSFTSPPVSGTVYQNTNPYPVVLYLTCYATTSGTAGYVEAFVGPTSSPSFIFNEQVAGTTTSTQTGIVVLIVPAGWYFKFTNGSGVTFAGLGYSQAY